MNAYVRPRMPAVVWLLSGSILAAYAAYSFAQPDVQLAADATFALIPERFHADSQFRYQTWHEALAAIFGHSFLHLGLVHLALNVFFLFVMSRAPALRLGALPYLVVYFSAVTAGALMFLALNWNEQGLVVGASGGVCGMMSAHFLSARATWREALADPQIRGLWGALVLLNVVVLGVVSEFGWLPVAWEGHLGGFIGGAIAYVLLQPRAPAL